MHLEVDLGLVRKYNKPGPRYTSYPTAPHFSEAVGVDAWEGHLRENNRSGARDLSLYFHFPFCDTLCWFCGCTVVISRRREKIDEYLEYLYREIDLVRSRLHEDRTVVQMHYGGGTPTHLTPDQIRRLGEKLNRSFTFAPDAEISCEMDPRGLTREHIQALREAGFNRASMGVQDFDLNVQQAVNRIHSKEMVQETIGWIREAGYDSINLDLIYGLPHQNASSFSKTLEDILDLNPERLAVFSYAHVPWLKPHQKLVKEADLPAPSEKLSMLKMIIETLTASGYVYVGMDHFAKEDDELTLAQREGSLQRNFQGYSTKSGADIYALGMSSISQLEAMYAQNTKDLPAYYARVARGVLPIEKGYVLSHEDRIRRHVIMRLMCDMALDFDELSRELHLDFEDYFQDELARLDEFEADGLLWREPDRVTLTTMGRLLVRNIAMTFDAYLVPSEARFSKTI